MFSKRMIQSLSYWSTVEDMMGVQVCLSLVSRTWHLLIYNLKITFSLAPQVPK